MSDLIILMEVLGIFFPVPGLLIMAVFAGLKKGRERLYIFIFGPAVIFIIHFLLHYLGFVDGNLASAAALGIYASICVFYYLGLGLYGLIKGVQMWLNRKQKNT